MSDHKARKMLDRPCAKCKLGVRTNNHGITSYCTPCYKDIQLGSVARSNGSHLSKKADWYRPATPDMPEDQSDIFSDGFTRPLPGTRGRRYSPGGLGRKKDDF